MKKALIAIVLLGLIAAGVGFYMFNKEHDETADMKAAFSMTTTAVIDEFVEDEAAATTKFNDQIIEVSGPLMELMKENGMVVGLKLGEDDLSVVNCSMQNPIDPAELNIAEGQSVKIKGVCSGFNSSDMLPGGDVELKRCTLVTE